jgi:hypothetical protein
MPDYTRNHYVPVWYQRRFLPAYLKEKKFAYLDLSPDSVISNKRIHKRKALLRWGPPQCFFENDLYTTKFGTWESTEIEEKFFGKVDTSGRAAVEYFDSFRHPSADGDSFNAMILFMSIQKLRTPKGLADLGAITKMKDKNLVLIGMQKLQNMFCALWTECIWSIADASRSQTKFIISDHPVTVYNKKCFPLSKWCRGFKDPDIWLSGTHTIFPLSVNKVLILTNLSWVRNPYMDPLKSRPNPDLFRPAIFKFTEIQTGRMLTDLEVNEINFIIKKRAFRYIAAADKEWLYPERKLVTQQWDKLGNEYLLMPEPRSVTFSSEIVFGYDDGRRADWTDAYGRKPWQRDYDDKTASDIEWNTFHAFRSEFARIFGPKHRGQTYEYGQMDKDEDSPEYHASLLRQEQEYKQRIPDKFRKKRRLKKK